ncbi:MAG: tyrosine-type recombinase/integrase [Ignavibacteriae bacterium]|nr:tyrosine-type recombinase/integrase [Ignavibacteriota bacterium]
MVNFEDILKRRGYKEKTVESYSFWIKDLNNFYHPQNLDTLKQEQIIEYLQHLKNVRHLSISSLKSAKYSIDLFFLWCLEKKLDFNNFKIGWVRRPVVKILNQSDIFAIVKNLETSFHKLAVSMIYAHGLELNELLNLKIKSVDLKNQVLEIPVARKKEIRKSVIPQKLISEITLFISNRDKNEYLFPGHSGKKLSESTLQKSFGRARKEANISEEFSIRSLKTAYIIHLKRLGIPIANIVENLKIASKHSREYYNSLDYRKIEVDFSPFDRDLSKIEELDDVINESYISEKRITELSLIISEKYDLTRLIELLRELNISYQNNSLMSIALITRAIIDQIPPIFGFDTFNQVENNYQSSKSFKKAMNHLNNSLRNVADSYLHITVRKRESIPTFQQVDFRSDLDLLLSEIIRIIK